MWKPKTINAYVNGKKVCDVVKEALAHNMMVELMDDDLREQLHREMAPCTNQEFYDAYVKAHAERFNGEKFKI